MVNSKQLGRAIRQARRQAGLTQDGLSDKAGLAYSTLAKIEQGAIKAPSFFTVYSLADALGISIEQLLSRAAGKTPPPGDKRQKIKFVYSDLNGVLVRFYHRAFADIAGETGSNIDVVETLFWHYNNAVNKGEMSLDEFNRKLAARLGAKKIDWKERYMEAVRPVRQMHNFLREIHKRVKIGLLTNTMPGFVAELRRRGKLPDLRFDAVVDSSEVGMVKPEPGIYAAAEKMSGFRGDAILLIDDSRTNLIAAEKFGWQVVWFDDYEPGESVRRLREALLDNG